jgi:GNAT superfamily N-acetyltransferase
MHLPVSQKNTPLPIEIRVITPRFVNQLAELQKLAYPTLTPNELFDAENYIHHIDLFHDGQYMAVVHHPKGDRVVGSSASLRVSSDIFEGNHSFAEIIDNGWMNNHTPRGEWLYGVDMAVHPNYRNRGIAKKLYVTRYNVVRRLNLRGEIIGGMMPGYERYRHLFSVEDYVVKVADGSIADPTLTPQLKQGFSIKGVLYDYITDPRSDNCAVLMVRENPEHIQFSLSDLPD